MSDKEAFEKWAENDYMLGHTNGRYGSRFTQCAWEAWQAALQHAGQGEAATGESGWQLREVYFDDDLIPTAYRAPQPVVSEEWVKRLDEALDLTYRDDIRPARSCLLQLRKALLSAGKGETE
jgi:hypothetical protein